MKKQIFAILMVLLLMLAFAACSGDKKSSSAPISGEIHSTGVFKVMNPKNWLIIPFIFNGEPDPANVGIYKGAKNEMDMMSTPGLQISYPSTRARQSKDDRYMYTDVSDLEPIKIGNNTWEGFTAKTSGRPFAILWTDARDEKIQVTIWLEVNKKKLAVTDADVQAIIASITLEPEKSP